MVYFIKTKIFAKKSGFNPFFMQCLDNPRALISKRCDFYGTKLCCQLDDNYRDITCDVTSSSNEDASEMRGMLEAAEIRMKKLIFQKGTPPGGKYCLKMGICCVKGVYIPKYSTFNL